MSAKKQSKNAQKRHWVHTIWPGHVGLEDDCTAEEFIQAVNEVIDEVRTDGRLRYLTGQIEVGDGQGVHGQVYTEWATSLRRTQVCKALPSHAEYRTGTRAQARDYCRKAEGRVQAFRCHGEWRAERGDDDFGQQAGPKARALAMVLAGKDPMQIAVEDPECFFTFHRSIVSLYGALELAKQRSLKQGPPEVTIPDTQERLTSYTPTPSEELSEEE